MKLPMIPRVIPVGLCARHVVDESIFDLGECSFRWMLLDPNRRRLSTGQLWLLGMSRCSRLLSELTTTLGTSELMGGLIEPFLGSSLVRIELLAGGDACRGALVVLRRLRSSVDPEGVGTIEETSVAFSESEQFVSKGLQVFREAATLFEFEFPILDPRMFCTETV